MKNCFAFVLLFFGPYTLSAQLTPVEIEIPMRDGESLAADLYLPDQNSAYPVILIQTPYNRKSFRNSLPLGIGTDISNSPYAFVVLDWRCFYESISACGGNATRGEDGYDAVEWIAKEDWSNGMVATWGPSALGNVQYQTAREQPPSLVCAIPLVSAPQTYYEQYYPGGIAEHAYLETLAFLFGGGINIYSQNPYKSFLWNAIEAATKYYDEITVPMLNIAGWFDHNIEECIDNHLGLTEQSPAGRKHKLLIGPWVHGGVGPASTGTENQGDLSFPEAAGWHNEIGREFLDFHLLNESNGWDQSPSIQYFSMGKNIWKSSDDWPPFNTETQTYYLDSEKNLKNELSETEASISYKYDPENPTPTKGGKTLHPNLEQGPFDISTIIENRDDAITFTTEELTSDLEVVGKIKATINFSSDRTDTDIILKVTDVFPDGRSIQLDESFLRLRFRNGFTVNDEALITPGNVYSLDLEFENLVHTFLKGHKIRIVITSSSYIRLNRNMNNGEALYPNNNLDTIYNPLIATNTIHTGLNYPSKIELPVTNMISSLSEIPHTNHINLYPNPAADYIEIMGNEGEPIIIRNNLGQILYKGEFSDRTLKINIQTWPQGLYWCSNYQFIITR